MDYYRPETVEDALAILRDATPRILAGGSDVYPSLRDRPLAGPLLDIMGLRELRHVERDVGHWSIGALATWTDIRRAELPPAFCALKQAGAQVGSEQIQNRATVAGNVCNASPAADGVPPLLALDCIVVAQSAGGERRVPLGAFIKGNRKTDLRPGEMVTRLLVPQSSAEGASRFVKLGARAYLVISIAMVAVRVQQDGGGRIRKAAIAVGACSEVAKRMEGVERALTEMKIANLRSGDFTIAEADLAGLTPIGDVRAPAGYRRHAAGELIRRALMDAAGEAA